MIGLIVLISYLGVSFGYLSTVTPTPDYPIEICCTIDGVQLVNTSIQEGDFFYLNQTIFDNVQASVRVPPTDSLKYGTCVSSVNVESNRYVTSRYVNSGISFTVLPIDESKEISHPGDNFYYNFTLSLSCKNEQLKVYAKIPIHDTNTYTPIFSKQSYKYTLISPLDQDLERLQELEPIIANDNDISNTELIFAIGNNPYFDIQYKDVVPNSLNKNHSAILVPKKPNTPLPNPLELTVFVTDMGYPPKSSNATIIIQPANLDIPAFKEAFYVGDYYANNTFSMRSQPELESPYGSYNVVPELSGSSYVSYFIPSISGNGTVEIRKSYNNLPELVIYKYNYLVFALTVTYMDKNIASINTKGNTTVIIEFHH